MSVCACIKLLLVRSRFFQSAPIIRMISTFVFREYICSLDGTQEKVLVLYMTPFIPYILLANIPYPISKTRVLKPDTKEKFTKDVTMDTSLVH